MAGINSQISEDIISFMNSNDDYDNSIDNYPKLKLVCKDSEAIKNVMKSLLTSELKEFGNENFDFFKRSYFEFIDGTVADSFNIEVDGRNEVLKIDEIQKRFKDDAFFSELKNLYKFADYKCLKKHYDLIVLDNLLKEMRRKNRFSRVCPTCQNDSVEFTNLDHFLPKKFFPHLSLFNNNLIPICVKCNSTGAKGEKIPKLPNLHPYKTIPIDCIGYKFIGRNEPCELLYDKTDEKICNFIDLFNLKTRLKEDTFVEILKEEIDCMNVSIAEEIFRDKHSLSWIIDDGAEPFNRLTQLVVLVYIPWYLERREDELNRKIESFRNYRLGMLKSVISIGVKEEEIKKIVRNILSELVKLKLTRPC